MRRASRSHKGSSRLVNWFPQRRGESVAGIPSSFEQKGGNFPWLTSPASRGRSSAGPSHKGRISDAQTRGLMQPVRRRPCVGALSVTLVSICALASSTQAVPISPRVKTACRYDYYKLCSAYDVGSQELRQCMDSMGDRLSQGCIEALIAAGEISQREVDSRKADH